MDITPQQAGKEAFDTTMRKGVDTVAVFLKENYNMLTLVNNDLAPADQLKDGDYRRMADELIKSEGNPQKHISRGFHAKDKDKKSVFISLDEIDAKLNESEGGKNFLKDKGVDSVSKLVPTRNQLSVTANAIANGVAEETGTIGFLNGATFMSALVGLFKWIFSGFENGFEGLKHTIAEVSADNMQASVTQNLERLNTQHPELQKFVDVADIGKHVHEKVLQRANGINAPEENLVAAAKVKPVDQAFRDFAAGEIKKKARDMTTAAIKENIAAQKQLIKDGKDENGHDIGKWGGKGDLLSLDGALDRLKNGAARIGALTKGAAVSAADGLGWNDVVDIFAGVPSDKEIERVSDIVAERTSTMMTQDGYMFKGNGKSIAEMNPRELAEAVQTEVKNDLLVAKRKGEITSFNDANIEQIAQKAGDAVATNKKIVKFHNTESSDYAKSRAAAADQLKGLAEGGVPHDGPNGKPLANLTPQSVAERGAGG